MLVVAGSGRSGTSLFTGLTGRLGVHIPKPEVSANRSNPRGFGEPRWLVDYHNELLSMVDVAIEDGRPEAWELTDKVAEQPEVLDGLVDVARDAVRGERPDRGEGPSARLVLRSSTGPRPNGSAPRCTSRPCCGTPPR